MTSGYSDGAFTVETRHLSTDETAVFADIAGSLGGGREVEWAGSAPKHEFLSWLGDHGHVLHGSNIAGIEVFEPWFRPDAANRPRSAIYATRDGAWPIFFATLDRRRYRGSIRNFCRREVDGRGHTRRTTYWFSVNRAAIDQDQWCGGVVYILPDATFVPFAESVTRGETIDEWTSELPVAPLGWLAVDADDFPYRGHLQVHDDDAAIRLGQLQDRLVAAFDRVETIDDAHFIHLHPAVGLRADMEELVELAATTGAGGGIEIAISGADTVVLEARGQGAGQLADALARAADSRRRAHEDTTPA